MINDDESLIKIDFELEIYLLGYHMGYNRDNMLG